MKYKVNGQTRTIGEFGRSTQEEFDAAIAVLPELVKKSRAGNTEAGETANRLLWALANKSFSTYEIYPTTFKKIYQIGTSSQDQTTDDEFLKFNVVERCNDEEGKYEAIIDVILAVSEIHASMLLRDSIKYGKYPKGVWLEYFLNGKRVELDTRGRIPA